MWTGPQIEAESPRKQRGTLSRPRPVRRGKGKRGVGDTVKGKGVSQEGGEGRRRPSRRYNRESSFPGVKMGGGEADDSPPSGVEVKNDGAIPTLPIRLHGVVLH
jgi:hypothetical protein